MRCMAAILGLALFSGLLGEAKAQPPSLPTGLSPPQQDEPNASNPPVLPPGLIEAPEADQTRSDEMEREVSETRLFTGLTGFIDWRVGSRARGNRNHPSTIMHELRGQVRGEWSTPAGTFALTTDLVLDDVEDDLAVNLNTGEGFVDVREASLLLRPTGNLDLKVGRQVLTWGTGDLIFLNDLFPKDYVSFFGGRDEEYLKAPSDALRASLFFNAVNVEFIYVPQFDADRFLTGERLSYFNPALDGIVGPGAVIAPTIPDRWFQDDELAIRLYRQFGTFEVAGYAYRGFWKSPAGQSASGTPVFPELSVYGASARGPVLGGIASAEFAYYDSMEDGTGRSALTPNSQLRWLVGFEREAGPNRTIGVQYYQERRMQIDSWARYQTGRVRSEDETRHLVSARLTQLAANQNLTLSAIAFWSPNQDELYVRATAEFKLNDIWRIDGGVNAFAGPRDDGFFSQFRDNSSIYFGVRRSFAT
jgi:hypothetical protein